jgi:hypothetical protein
VSSVRAAGGWAILFVLLGHKLEGTREHIPKIGERNLGLSAGE